MNQVLDGDDMARMIAIVMAIILVGTALVGRRWTLGGALGMALAWVAIFGVVLALFSFRRELGFVGDRVRSEQTGAPQQQVVGRTMRITVSADGHYWVDGSVNSTPARFLIDSGASVTAISEDVAAKAGLAIDRSRVVRMRTANGPAEAAQANVPGLTVGPIVANDIAVVVSPTFGDVNILGMNFLSALKSWRVEHGEMVLEPQ